MNEWDMVRQFEKEVAEFAGSEYAVAMESCTFALFICCQYLFGKERCRFPDNTPQPIVVLPSHTYPGVPCGVIHAGGRVIFQDYKWQGAYPLSPYPIWDSAKRFRPNMYIHDSYYCLSFHAKKRIPIGRGGMVLTNDKDFVDWTRVAIRDGKQEGVPFAEQKFNILGWNAYMTPEQAARGLLLFHSNKVYDDLLEIPDYPDLSKMEIYK